MLGTRADISGGQLSNIMDQRGMDIESGNMLINCRRIAKSGHRFSGARAIWGMPRMHSGRNNLSDVQYGVRYYP